MARCAESGSRAAALLARTLASRKIHSDPKNIGIETSKYIVCKGQCSASIVPANITLNIEPQPHVRTMPVQYPASEVYYFKPLNERVPVYQKPFTLVMDVVADATAEARKALAGRSELVLDGTLEYQACDDKICYNPVSIPLSWRVALRENVPGAPRPPQPTR